MTPENAKKLFQAMRDEANSNFLNFGFQCRVCEHFFNLTDDMLDQPYPWCPKCKSPKIHPTK